MPSKNSSNSNSAGEQPESDFSFVKEWGGMLNFMIS